MDAKDRIARTIAGEWNADGNCALVVGATVLMLIALAHQSVRGHRATPRTVGTDPAPTKVPVPQPQQVPAGED